MDWYFADMQAQSSVDILLSFFSKSSELGLPHPLTQTSVYGVHLPPPLVPGGGHTRLQERGWGGPNLD